MFAWGLSQDQIERLNVIGFGSPFHERYGYFIDPVGPETALLPEGWRERAIRIDVGSGGAAGWCPEVHDLAVSKLARSDERDLEYVANLLYHRLARPSRLNALVETMEVEDKTRDHLRRGLKIAQRRAGERRSSGEVRPRG